MKYPSNVGNLQSYIAAFSQGNYLRHSTTNMRVCVCVCAYIKKLILYTYITMYIQYTVVLLVLHVYMHVLVLSSKNWSAVPFSSTN